MKRNIKLSIMAIVATLLFFSCEQDDLGTAPAPISNPTSEAVVGGIILKWDNPVDRNFEYVRIECSSPNTEKRVQTVSKHVVDSIGYPVVEMDCFPNQEEYLFKFYASNSKGALSAPVELRATPGKPIFELITPTLTVEPGANAIDFTWENHYRKLVNIEVHYAIQNDEDNANVQFFTHIKDSTYATAKLENLEGGKVYDLTVTVRDRLGNGGEGKHFSIKPKKAILDTIPKTAWTIPGYDEKTATGTIGYSSQAINEGDAPKGRAIAIFDGKTETFWHASWSGTVSKYPHFLIIDLGEDKLFTRIGLFGRQDDNRKNAQKGQRFYTCTDADAVDKTNTADWKWKDHGFDDFNVEDEKEQMFDIDLENKPARYLKIYFDEKDSKGTGDYAMLAEVNLYHLKVIEDEDD